MTRVAHLAGTSLPKVGGMEVMVHGLADEQVRRGHDVTVVSRWPIARLWGRVPYRVRPLVPTTFHRALRRPLNDRGPGLLRRQLAWHQRGGRLDVWHVHAAHLAGWASAVALRDLGVAAVLTAHGPDLMVDAAIGYGHRLKPEVDRRIRATITAFPAVVAINPEIHDAFVDLGVPPHRIHGLPNGVDADRIAAHAVAPDEARRRLGLPPDGPLVVTVARHDRFAKGIDVLLEAADRLRHEVDGLTWLLVGPGVTALAGEVDERGLAGVVRLDEGGGGSSPPDDRVLDAYRAADVGVVASRVEASSLVLFEAMAAGLPVVASDIPGNRVAVEPATGVLVPPADVNALVTALVTLLRDPRRRRALGEAARRRAARHDLRAVADGYDRIYAAARSEMAA